MKKLEEIFERFLWDSRLVVLLAVIASIGVGVAMFYVATVDAYYVLSHLAEYASPQLDAAARADLRSTTIAHVVEIIDGYLLGTVLLIFALGLYELFISKIDMAARSEKSSRVLLITSLDDLKSRLAKVILMILIVKFFEHAIRMVFSNPLDLLYLAAGIALIGAAILMSHSDTHNLHGKKEHPEKI